MNSVKSKMCFTLVIRADVTFCLFTSFTLCKRELGLSLFGFKFGCEKNVKLKTKLVKLCVKLTSCELRQNKNTKQKLTFK